MGELNASRGNANGSEPYLTTVQLRYFRDRLLLWRLELYQSLTGCPDDVLVENLPDLGDAASRQVQAEMSWAERARVMSQVRQVDAALGRIAAGTYGYCLESGEEIGIRRLMALPTAQYCVDAQHDIERRNCSFR